MTKRFLGALAVLSIGMTGTVGVPAAAQAAGFDSAPRPTLTGTAHIGETLTVAGVEAWTPAPDWMTCQWLRDGRAVTEKETLAAGAPCTYDITGEDLGSRLSAAIEPQTYGGASQKTSTLPTPAVTGDFTETPTPVVSGGTVVGQDLTADPGVWEDGTLLSYQWLSDGVEIPGATAQVYRLTASEIGQSLQVQVTAKKQHITPATVVSDPTAPVEGVLGLTPKPTITGTVKVGQTLTAAPGTWDEGVELTYQWLRGGAPVDGATDPTYVLSKADFGFKLQVQITGTKPWHAPATVTSAETGTVADELTLTPTPKVSGKAQVGQTLTATPGTWDAGVKLSYQWLRNGAAISGATKSAYKLTTTDQGKKITVKVTGALAGFPSVSKTSAATATVAAMPTVWVQAPKISGSQRVGANLSVKPAGTAKTTFTYQWYRNGKAISKATKSSYKLTGSDKNTRVQVKVSGKLAGYASSYKYSAKTAKIAAQPKTWIKSVTITGAKNVGRNLGAKVQASKSTKLTYQWYRNGKAISKATKSVYTLTASDRGKAISVKVKGTRSTYVSSSKWSRKTGKIGYGTLAKPSPSISGSRKVDQTLTANTKWSSKSGVKVAYRWYVNGKYAGSASTLKLGSSAVGKKVQVKITGTKWGYREMTQWSSKTGAVAKGTISGSTPKITGTAEVESTVKATASWGPSGVKYGYQWYVGDSAVKGATAASFKVPASAGGKTVKVKLTGTKSGYTTKTSTSGGVAIPKPVVLTPEQMDRAVENRFFKLLNDKRKSLGLSVLSRATNYTDATRAWSGVMADKDLLHHSDAAHWAEYGLEEPSENVGGAGLTSRGIASADSYFEAMMKSPGHCRTMLDSPYLFAEVGIARTSDGDYNYITLNLDTVTYNPETTPEQDQIKYKVCI